MILNEDLLIHLDVLSGYFLTEKDNLLPSLNTGAVVRHVHDLQLLLGLCIKDGVRHNWIQHHFIFSRTGWILQKCLETQSDGIEIQSRVICMGESLSEGINLDLLPVTETLMDILPADTLHSEMRKLHSHLLVVHINSADSLLTALPPNLQQM